MLWRLFAWSPAVDNDVVTLFQTSLDNDAFSIAAASSTSCCWLKLLYEAALCFQPRCRFELANRSRSTRSVTFFTRPNRCKLRQWHLACSRAKYYGDRRKLNHFLILGPPSQSPSPILAKYGMRYLRYICHHSIFIVCIGVWTLYTQLRFIIAVSLL